MSFTPYLTGVAHTKGFEPLWLMVWSLGRAGRAGQGAQGAPLGGGMGCRLAGTSAGQDGKETQTCLPEP